MGLLREARRNAAGLARDSDVRLRLTYNIAHALCATGNCEEAEVLAEENLVPVNRNDDITKASDVATITEWDEREMEQRLDGAIKDAEKETKLKQDKVQSVTKVNKVTKVLLVIKATKVL